MPGDPMLERAIECPSHFMFAEEAVFEAGGYEVVFTSARDPRTNADGVRLSSSKMVVFRADAGRDDFTRQGGVYWRCRAAEGKFQFKRSAELDRTADGQPLGPLVLAVRDGQGTVRCYRLILDLRC